MANKDAKLKSLITASQKSEGPHPEADVYDFSISYLREITAANKVSTFLTKKTETRKHSKGTWRQDGETETVMCPGGKGVYGTKKVFRFLHPGGTPSSWFVTEFCIDKDYRARYKLPNPDHVVCKLEFVSQPQDEASSSKP